ncbi:2-amino-4-hydroxy-6-hydroxymethyldihydropteridine diphosphokinase [Idiomarina tyrosinivorans]|nr:2-amino-4-hydroxy-6-hydroxymethyldihydropteridine diphosphokinase [Idiomarina tyrosinivorans]
MRYLCSLGSNIQPEKHFREVKQRLASLSSSIRYSRAIQTQPVDIDTSKQFLNALFIIESALPEAALKQSFNQIEILMGRDRSDPLSSQKDRPIDIDILGIITSEAAFPDVPDYLHSLTADLMPPQGVTS